MKNILLIVALFIFSISSAQTDTITIVSYNLLNFPDGRNDCGTNTNVPNRFDTLRKILNYAQPDIFVACEIQNKRGADSILSRSLNVFGQTNYAAATYHNDSNGGDLQNMMYYNTEKLILHSQDVIETSVRDIDHYVLYVNDPNLSNLFDTTFIEVYMCHLKAGSGSTEQAVRNDQVTLLRNFIDSRPPNRNHFVCGDLNVYRSSESCYQTLTSGGSNPLVDPINSPGNWNNNGSFASLHTQSTRNGQNLDCGSQGGSDDRFDQILVSGTVMDGSDSLIYLANSYDAIGNDGNHFNSSLIAAPTNSQYPDSVVNALYYMSDHLPVTLKTVITYPTSNGLAINPAITNVSCNGEMDGAITINCYAGQSPYTYQWDSNAGNQTSQAISNLTAGTYCVTVTDALLETENICVIVAGPEEINFNIFQSIDNGACDGAAYVVISGDPTLYTYQWDDDLNQTTQSATNLCAGTYSVTVTNSVGCSTTNQVTVGGGTSGLEINPSNLFSVYPIPFQKELYIAIENETIVKNIAVYSPIGVKIFDITSPELTSNNHVKFSTEHLSSGVYFVQISTETATTIIQVVKN
jgi:hypothetical protein